MERGYRDPFTTVAEDVCVPCNNGWSEELEEWAERWLAKPIEGGSRVLRFWRQACAAAWAVKTAIVWESVEIEHRVMHPALGGIFHRLMRPSSRQQVWIGRYSGEEPNVFRRVGAYVIGSRPEGSGDPEHADAYLIAVGVGQLCFAVFGHLLAPPPQSREPIKLDLPDSLAPKLIQIWPLVHEVVEWPATDSLDDADIEALVRSLGLPIKPDPQTPEA